MATIVTVITLLISLLGAFWATPPGQAAFARYMRRIREERSHARLAINPAHELGAKLMFYSADIGGGSARVGETWEIEDMRPGLVGLRSLSKDGEWAGIYFPMTSTEFEAGSAFLLD